MTSQTMPPLYGEIRLEMVLQRAGLYGQEPGKLLGRGFLMQVETDRFGHDTRVAMITGVHFDPIGGLWLDIDVPSLFGLPVRGVQYLVTGMHEGQEEGWYIGLGDDPKGLFFKLKHFVDSTP